MSDDFSRRRSEWLDRVAADATLSPAAFRLAYILSGYINRETGKAWPTQETLAARSGLTDRAVRKQIAALVFAGYVNCAAGGGRHKPNIYTICEPKTRNESSSFSHENPEQKFHVSAGNPEQEFHLSDGNPELLGQKPGTKVPTELSEELSEYITLQKVSDSDTRPTKEIDADALPVGLAKKAARAAAAATQAQAFERFRAAYPRRPGSNWTKARESFDRALKRGVQPDEIIAGAVAYAGYNAREGNVGERARFIKLPVTWLNQSEWTADYGPVVSAPPFSAPTAEIAAADWRSAVERFRHTGGEWSRARFGPPPGSPGCRVPPEILSSSNQRVA